MNSSKIEFESVVKAIDELDVNSFFQDENFRKKLHKFQLVPFRSNGVSAVLKKNKDGKISQSSIKKVFRRLKKKNWAEKRRFAKEVFFEGSLESLVPNIIAGVPNPDPLTIATCTTYFILHHIYKELGIDQLSKNEVLILDCISEELILIREIFNCVHTSDHSISKKEFIESVKSLIEKGVLHQEKKGKNTYLVFIEKYK